MDQTIPTLRHPATAELSENRKVAVYGDTIAFSTLGTYYQASCLSIEDMRAIRDALDTKIAQRRAVAEQAAASGEAPALDAPTFRFFSDDEGESYLPSILAGAFGVPQSEARRLLAQGGVFLDDAPLSLAEMYLKGDALNSRVLRLGKRRKATLSHAGARVPEGRAAA